MNSPFGVKRFSEQSFSHSLPAIRRAVRRAVRRGVTDLDAVDFGPFGLKRTRYDGASMNIPDWQRRSERAACDDKFSVVSPSKALTAVRRLEIASLDAYSVVWITNR
jgi:hypothetical protein